MRRLAIHCAIAAVGGGLVALAVVRLKPPETPAPPPAVVVRQSPEQARRIEAIEKVVATLRKTVATQAEHVKTLTMGVKLASMNAKDIERLQFAQEARAATPPEPAIDYAFTEAFLTLSPIQQVRVRRYIAQLRACTTPGQLALIASRCDDIFTRLNLIRFAPPDVVRAADPARRQE